MEPNDRWKLIRPATDEPGQQRAPPDSKKKRPSVSVACIPCRNGKAKCDGIRPCVRCTNNDLRCEYDVAEGVSRAQRMKLIKRDGVLSRLEALERIVNTLRLGSRNEALDVLAKLRVGEKTEDVFSVLQATAHSGTTSRNSSLGPWESVGSSSKGTGFEAMQIPSEGVGATSYRPEFDPSLTLFAERRTSLPGSWNSSPIHASSSKQKQSQKASQVAKPFLSVIFNRQDCLLPSSDQETNEKEDESVGDIDANMDPRLVGDMVGIDGEDSSANSPMTFSELPSPQKLDATRWVHATHQTGRQPIVHAIRVHPNFNLNIPLSDSFRTSNLMTDAQGSHVNHGFLPAWAMMTINTRLDPGSLRHAFTSIHQEAIIYLETGAPLESIIEVHPNIAALFDEDAYSKSSVLSQWSASVVHSLHLSGNTFTNFATMYIFWYVMRWMISPSPETYEILPEWLRPTPNQLFMPHISILDFIPWPALRELAVQLPAMQERMMWLMDMITNMRCDWWHAHEDALLQNEVTRLVDLSPLAKEAMRNLSNWSVGPSFRGYVSNADSYVRIRTED